MDLTNELITRARCASKVRREAKLLLGVGAHAVFGWWWADPITATRDNSVRVARGTRALNEAPGVEGRKCGDDDNE